MAETPRPIVALVGFKRTKVAMAGGQRVLVVRDGTVRLLGKDGRVDLDVPAQQLTARLTRTKTVELRWDACSAVIFGVPDIGNVGDELVRIAASQTSEDTELIEPARTGFLGMYSLKAVTGPAKIGRRLTEALHQHGAHQG